MTSDHHAKLLRYGCIDELDRLYRAVRALAARKASRLDPLAKSVCDAYDACEAALEAEERAIDGYQADPDGTPAKLCDKSGRRL
jgi:hypothetical protein